MTNILPSPRSPFTSPATSPLSPFLSGPLNHSFTPPLSSGGKRRRGDTSSPLSISAGVASAAGRSLCPPSAPGRFRIPASPPNFVNQPQSPYFPSEVKSPPSVVRGRGLPPLEESRPIVFDEDGAEEEVFCLHRLPPEAPIVRLSREERMFQDPLISKIKQIYAQNALMKDGGRFPILSIHGAKGQHSQVYTISGSVQYIPDIDNTAIIVKLFQESVIQEEGPVRIKGFFSTLLTQYREIKDKLPVTTIHNAETALTDGFLIAEKVVPFMVPWDKDTDLNTLKTEHLLRLREIKKFIDFAVKQKTSIPLDLHRDNFGINKKGELVLLDFMEHEEDRGSDYEPGYAFNLIKKERIKSLANGNCLIEKFLESGTL